MSKYILIYKGPATDMADMTEEQGKAVMEKWGVWMGKVGTALTDVGSPFGPGASVVDDGSGRNSASLAGYSIGGREPGGREGADRGPPLSR